MGLCRSVPKLDWSSRWHFTPLLFIIHRTWGPDGILYSSYPNDTFSLFICYLPSLQSFGPYRICITFNKRKMCVIECLKHLLNSHEQLQGLPFLILRWPRDIAWPSMLGMVFFPSTGDWSNLGLAFNWKSVWGKSLSPNKVKNHYFAVVFLFSRGNENVIDADTNPDVTDFNLVKQLKCNYASYIFCPNHKFNFVCIGTRMFYGQNFDWLERFVKEEVDLRNV